LEDLRQINRLERKDEKPFEVVAALSEANERLYTLFARPFLRPLVNEGMAAWARLYHPLRVQHWAVSDLNPMLWPVRALAEGIKAVRHPAPPENPFRKAEQAISEVITSSLDLYRDVRDAATERYFFQVFGPLAALGAGDVAALEAGQPPVNPRDLPVVKEALEAIGTGGYPEAVGLVGALLGKGARAIPLSRLELFDRMIRAEGRLAQLPPDARRRIQAEQAVVAELEPEAGLRSLPKLLREEENRVRLLTLLDEVFTAVEATPEQMTMLVRIRALLETKPSPVTADETNQQPAAVA
jgi:hypothetical protein